VTVSVWIEDIVVVQGFLITLVENSVDSAEMKRVETSVRAASRLVQDSDRMRTIKITICQGVVGVKYRGTGWGRYQRRGQNGRGEVGRDRYCMLATTP